MNKKIKLMAIALMVSSAITLFNIASPQYRNIAIVHATVVQTDYKVLPSKTAVDINKAFSVKFTELLNPLYVIKDNVYVLDSNGNKVDVNVKLSGILDTIVVTPNTNYKANTTYTLYVTTNVKSVTLKNLKQAVKMQFTTKAEVGSQTPAVPVVPVTPVVPDTPVPAWTGEQNEIKIMSINGSTDFTTKLTDVSPTQTWLVQLNQPIGDDFKVFAGLSGTNTGVALTGTLSANKTSILLTPVGIALSNTDYKFRVYELSSGTKKLNNGITINIKTKTLPQLDYVNVDGIYTSLKGGEYEDFTNAPIIETNHKFILNMNQEITQDTVNSSSVGIYDWSDGGLMSKAYLGEDKKSIVVVPQAKYYVKGGHYMFLIRFLQGSEGRIIKNLRLPFISN